MQPAYQYYYCHLPRLSMFLMLKGALVDCSTGNWAKALHPRRVLGTRGFGGGLRRPLQGRRSLPGEEALQSSNRPFRSVQTLAGLGAPMQADFSPNSLMIGDGSRRAGGAAGVRHGEAWLSAVGKLSWVGASCVGRALGANEDRWQEVDGRVGSGVSSRCLQERRLRYVELGETILARRGRCNCD